MTPTGNTTSAEPATNSPLARRLQILLVAIAVGVAAAILMTEEKVAFGMLAYIDGRVGFQESQKDVRCWSSFNKLQMFITGAEIDDEAKQTRIEKHVALLNSIWQEGKQADRGNDVISGQTISSILARRFPQVDLSGGVQFDLGVDNALVTVDENAIRDYSDTIEPWRLLQTWASRHLDDDGQFSQIPPFGEDALLVVVNFLRSYDLAVLRHARNLARERQLSSIDAAAIAKAFESNSSQENATR